MLPPGPHNPRRPHHAVLYLPMPQWIIAPPLNPKWELTTLCSPPDQIGSTSPCTSAKPARACRTTLSDPLPLPQHLELKTKRNNVNNGQFAPCFGQKSMSYIFAKCTGVDRLTPLVPQPNIGKRGVTLTHPHASLEPNTSFGLERVGCSYRCSSVHMCM
jgi:hypothetical protein